MGIAVATGVGVATGDIGDGAGTGVGVGGTGVGGGGVLVGGTGVLVGGSGVLVGSGVSVDTAVLVGGGESASDTGVSVTIGVLVSVGTGVFVGGIGVFVKVGSGVLVGRGVPIWATGVFVAHAMVATIMGNQTPVLRQNLCFEKISLVGIDCEEPIMRCSVMSASKSSILIPGRQLPGPQYLVLPIDTVRVIINAGPCVALIGLFPKSGTGPVAQYLEIR